MKLVFDIDGTLADFDGAGGVERMQEKGFFKNLKPYPRVVSTIKRLSRNNDVYILSACIDSEYCEKEKMEWIDKYMPFIPKQNILLIEYGSVKAKEFEKAYNKRIDKNDVLFDDYKVNLIEWIRAGGSAVKCGKSFKPNRQYPQLVKFANIGELVNNL